MNNKMKQKFRNLRKTFSAFIFALFALFLPVSSDGKETSDLTLEQFVAGITERAAPLIYISETDSEVWAFYRNRTVESLSVSEFKRVMKLPPLSTVETRTFDEFFNRLIDADPSGNWENVRYYIENNTSAQIVFRVRRPEPYENSIDFYAVGLFGNLIVGIQTFGIET